jgi:hypothetical protein
LGQVWEKSYLLLTLRDEKPGWAMPSAIEKPKQCPANQKMVGNVWPEKIIA